MRYLFRTVGIFILALLFITPAAVRAGAGPVIWVQPNEMGVAGLYWPDGAEVTLTIDDPGTGQAVDYTDSATAGPSDFDPQLFLVEFDLQGLFDVQSGHEVTLTDGVTTKMHTATGLMITGVDPEADVVDGTAAPGSDVQIDVWTDILVAGATRHEVADGGGNWTADFSAPGDEAGEDAFDIAPTEPDGFGGFGPAFQEDAEGDRTLAFWSVDGGDGDQQPNVQATPFDDRIDGNGWPLGAEVTLTIDGSGVSTAADYTDSATVEEAPWDPQQTYFSFELQGTFDVMPGQVVTVTDNVTTKTLTITAPTITGIDPAADTISGTATPGANVGVGIDIPPEGAGRNAVADASGEWTVDFSTPGGGGEGGDGPAVDIAFGQNLQGNISENDEDGDATNIHFLIAPASGDVNCSGAVDPVDSLSLLRFDAGLPVNLPTGCPPIGSY